MASVHINQPGAATAIACFERPTHVGHQVFYFDDFTDTWMQRYISDGTDPVGEGLVIVPGDIFEFDIKLPFPHPTGPADQYGLPDITDGNVPRPVGIDLKFIAGPYLSDWNLLDSNGEAVADGERQGVTRTGVWYHVSASLNDYAGLYLRVALLNDDGEPEATRRVVYFKRIVITNGGAIRFTFWNGEQITPGPTQSNTHLMAGGKDSFSLLDVGIEGPLTIFGTLEADVVTGPYASPMRTVTDDTIDDTIGIYDSTVVYNQSGSIDANLPPAATVGEGREITFKNIHATGDVTLVPDGSEEIDGAASYALASQWDTVTLRVNGNDWIIV